MAVITRRVMKKEVRIGLEPQEREPLVKEVLKAKKRIDALRIAQGDANASFRKDIKEEKDKLDEACASLERGRPVMREVEEIIHWANGTVKYRDVELDRIVEERPVSSEDKQGVVGEVNEDETAKKGKAKKGEEAAAH